MMILQKKALPFLLMAIFAAPSAFSDVLARGKVEAALKLSPAGGFNASTETVYSDIKKNPTAKPQAFTLTYVKVKVTDLKTGISLRDEHLHKHLKAQTYPWVEAKNFKFTSATAGTADVSLYGSTQTLPITFKAGTSGTSFSFVVVPSKFKIEEAKYLGIKVKDEVKVDGNLTY